MQPQCPQQQVPPPSSNHSPLLLRSILPHWHRSKHQEGRLQRSTDDMAVVKAILAVVAVAALAVQLAGAADHAVGGSGAWDASGTSYNAWSTKQKFVQGDTMSFKYAASHDVTEVTKAGYDACSGANPVKSYTGGATTVKLAAPGKRYFICSVPGHCAAGMKLEVTVAAAAPAPAKSKPRHQRSVSPTPATAMAPEPSSVPSTDDGLPTVSTPTAAPAPKPSGASSTIAMFGAKAGMAIAVGMALALAI